MDNELELYEIFHSCSLEPVQVLGYGEEDAGNIFTEYMNRICNRYSWHILKITKVEKNKDNEHLFTRYRYEKQCKVWLGRKV